MKIEKLVYGGEGLSRAEGEVVFTPFVLPGETVEAERTGSRKQAQRARATKIVESSPDRTSAVCPYFERCGGCQYQHIDYAAQLRYKRSILAETLRRVGKIDYSEDLIAVSSAEPYGYRNRVQLHFEKGRMGFREMNSRKLVAIDRCPISSPKINEAIAKVSRMARDRRWPRFLRALEIFTDERHVQWNVLETDQPVARHFFEWLAEEIPGSVLGPLEYAVNEDTFTVSGQGFFQVNRFLLPKLAELAIGDASGERAFDLYAGVGLFSLPLARRFSHVIAVESGRAAAADLKANARRARVSVKVEQGQTDSFLIETSETPDFVLADPPRSGLERTAITRLIELKPKTVALVSCDPATLARDLAALSDAYRIETLRLVDLFPQTFHVETIARLVSRSSQS
ncbi:MAG TPA: class I SAM-dependent RNA methyltransferase [Bryobacteraceae bacterium]|nr:class I SAM-dependent RNA methyltransferase [Bryobacteraceae bacterium]